MQLSSYCTAALLTVIISEGSFVQAPASLAASAQETAVQPATGDAEFTLFISGSRVGVERVRLMRSGSTWIISSTAQFGAPLYVTLNRFEMRYTADWRPIELHVEATQTTPQ